VTDPLARLRIAAGCDAIDAPPLDVDAIGMDLELAELRHPNPDGSAGDGTTRLIHTHVPALLAALDRILAECDRSWAAADCYGPDDDATRDLVTRIRAAISGTSTWTCDCCGATNHATTPPRRVDACHLCEHDRANEEPTR